MSASGPPSSPRALAIDPRDEVAVVLADVRPGDSVTVTIGADTIALPARQAIPIYHKIALRAVAQGAPVHKYGAPIGVATRPIAPGEHVHTHNLRSAALADGKGAAT